MRHVRLWLFVIGGFSLVAQAVGAAAVLWRGPDLRKTGIRWRGLRPRENP
jgi:hypothetical protein